jgi:hypothetical protein
MPYQGPWSEFNHCNDNMLAARKHDASALFWYTQRYHGPRTVEQDPTAGVTVPNPYSRAAGQRTGDPGSGTLRLGHWAFSISVVDSLGGGLFGCLCHG